VDAVDKIQTFFAVRNTPAVALKFCTKLGSDFFLFSANLMDSAHVHVLPEQPFPTVAARPTPIAATTSIIPEIGYAGSLTVEMDKECLASLGAPSKTKKKQ
jgi:hypothetical protein